MQINGKPGFKGAEAGDEALAIRAVQVAVAEGGVNFIDTARWYHDSQKRIARALSELEGGREVYIASKVSPELSPENIRRQVETCLHDLRRDHIEIMQIHSGSNKEKREATLPVLHSLRDQGLFDYIGITLGYGPAAYEQARQCLRLCTAYGRWDGGT